MKEKTTITDQDIENAIKALNSKQPGIGDYEQMNWKEFAELMANSKHIPAISGETQIKNSWKFIKNKK